MRLKIGSAIRPQNEAVASISYQPIYDVSRLVVNLRERWDISGRIVPETNATQSLMTAALAQLKSDFDQGVNNDLVFLEDFTNKPTGLQLLRRNCNLGPYIVDSSLPNQTDDCYATGLSYRIVFEAVTDIRNGSNLLKFQETFDNVEPGGTEIVYVGGAVNYPERQIGSQHKPYRYIQAGSATGLYAYPAIPPCLFPFACTRYEFGSPFAKVSKKSPKVLGSPDTEFDISWEYEFAWHLPLNGIPHRRS